jgi:hypothetical protein
MKVPMKAAGFAALSVSLSLSAFAVQARDSVHYFPIDVPPFSVAPRFRVLG